MFHLHTYAILIDHQDGLMRVIAGAAPEWLVVSSQLCTVLCIALPASKVVAYCASFSLNRVRACNAYMWGAVSCCSVLCLAQVAIVLVAATDPVMCYYVWHPVVCALCACSCLGDVP